MDEVEVLKLRKFLCWILRSSKMIKKETAVIDDDGYVDLVNILKLCRTRLHRNYDVDDIQKFVENDDKQRFKIRIHPETDDLQMKANYGHHIPIPVSMNDFEPLTDENTIIVYGALMKDWIEIQNSGINRGDKTLIHLDMYNSIRRNAEDSEIHIFINLKKALSDGIKFYKTTYDIVLSHGNEGILDKKYFSDVIHLPTSTYVMKIQY